MLTGTSFAAKAIELLLPAIISNKISGLSTRRKTAKLFKELYSILDSLLAVSQNIYYAACESQEISQPIFLYQELRRQSATIDSCSIRLISTVPKLSEVLCIYNETLLNDVEWIIAYKGSILSKISRSLEISSDGNRIKSITLQFPNEDLSRKILHKIKHGKEYPDWPAYMVDMEIRDQLKDFLPEEGDVFSQFIRWGTIYRADHLHVEKLFINKNYEGLNIQLASDLKDFLETHIIVIEDALQGLKEFIEKNFTIDEMF